MTFIFAYDLNDWHGVGGSFKNMFCFLDHAGSIFQVKVSTNIAPVAQICSLRRCEGCWGYVKDDFPPQIQETYCMERGKHSLGDLASKITYAVV